MITQSSIRLHNLRFYAYHGVILQERRVGGEYKVSLSVRSDISRAADSDKLADTLNYAELYQTVRREMAQPSQLLEHVAGRIGKAVLSDFPQVTEVEVTVTKLNPPMGADCEGASVVLTMNKEQ